MRHACSHVVGFRQWPSCRCSNSVPRVDGWMHLLGKGRLRARRRNQSLRSAVVRQLLGHGVPREAIRHEITFDMSSSDGRGDIIVALDQMLIGIELKSGSDTLDRLEMQRGRYRRRFDRLCLVIDKRLVPAEDEYWLNGWSFELKFGSIVVFSDGDLSQIPSYSTLPWVEQDHPCFPKGPSDHQAPAATLALLWANEVTDVHDRLARDGAIERIGNRTRCKLIPHIAEHASISNIRPLVAQALRNRQPNKWELEFWRRFDASAGVEVAP